MSFNVSNLILSLVLSSFCLNCHIIQVFHLLHMCLLKCQLEVHTKCYVFVIKFSISFCNHDCYSLV